MICHFVLHLTSCYWKVQMKVSAACEQTESDPAWHFSSGQESFVLSAGVT